MSNSSILKSHKRNTYIVLLIIAILSLTALIFADSSETMKMLTSSTFVGSLLIAIFQIIRDDKKFIEESIFQERQHTFNLAATSHMSEVVFDKHVQFSEEYVEEMNKILSILTSVGRKVEDPTIVFALGAVRVKYRLWVSKKMTEMLIDFERSINSIIGNSELIEYSSDMDKDKRKRLIDETYDKLKEILGLKGEGTGNELVISHLQDILGISKLTTLRDNLLFNQKEC